MAGEAQREITIKRTIEYKTLVMVAISARSTTRIFLHLIMPRRVLQDQRVWSMSDEMTMDIAALLELFNRPFGKRISILKRFATLRGGYFSILASKLQRDHRAINSILKYVRRGFSSVELDDATLAKFRWALVLLSRLAIIDTFKYLIYQENFIRRMPETWLDREHEGHGLSGIRLLYNMLKEGEAIECITREYIEHDVVYKVMDYGFNGNHYERLYSVKVIELLLKSDYFLDQMTVNEHLCTRIFQFLGVTLFYLRYSGCLEMFRTTLGCYLYISHVDGLWPQFIQRIPQCLADGTIQHYKHSEDLEASILLKALYFNMTKYAVLGTLQT